MTQRGQTAPRHAVEAAGRDDHTPGVAKPQRSDEQLVEPVERLVQRRPRRSLGSDRGAVASHSAEREHRVVEEVSNECCVPERMQLAAPAVDDHGGERAVDLDVLDEEPIRSQLALELLDGELTCRWVPPGLGAGKAGVPTAPGGGHLFRLPRWAGANDGRRPARREPGGARRAPTPDGRGRHRGPLAGRARSPTPARPSARPRGRPESSAICRPIPMSPRACTVEPARRSVAPSVAWCSVRRRSPAPSARRAPVRSPSVRRSIAVASQALARRSGLPR